MPSGKREFTVGKALMALFANMVLPSGLSRHRPARRGYKIIRRLNRSQNWRSARSYKEARALSPYPDRPVR